MTVSVSKGEEIVRHKKPECLYQGFNCDIGVLARMGEKVVGNEAEGVSCGYVCVHINGIRFGEMWDGWKAEVEKIFLEGEGTIEVPSHSARYLLKLAIDQYSRG